MDSIEPICLEKIWELQKSDWEKKGWPPDNYSGLRVKIDQTWHLMLTNQVAD